MAIDAPAVERAAIPARVDRGGKASRCRPRRAANVSAGRRPGIRVRVASASLPPQCRCSAMNSRLSIAVPRSLIFCLFKPCILVTIHGMPELACICPLQNGQSRQSMRADDVKSSRLPLPRRGLHALRRIERGQHDALVAGAAAEVAGDGDPHLLLGRVRLSRRNSSTWSACPACRSRIAGRGCRETPAAADTACRARARPSTVRISWPSACTASIRHERAGRRGGRCRRRRRRARSRDACR